MNIGSFGFGLVVTLMAAVQVGWYLAVLWLLIRIWQKVRHLPG